MFNHLLPENKQKQKLKKYISLNFCGVSTHSLAFQAINVKSLNVDLGSYGTLIFLELQYTSVLPLASEGNMEHLIKNM